MRTFRRVTAVLMVVGSGCSSEDRTAGDVPPEVTGTVDLGGVWETPYGVRISLEDAGMAHATAPADPSVMDGLGGPVHGTATPMTRLVLERGDERVATPFSSDPTGQHGEALGVRWEVMGWSGSAVTLRVRRLSSS